MFFRCDIKPWEVMEKMCRVRVCSDATACRLFVLRAILLSIGIAGLLPGGGASAQIIKVNFQPASSPIPIGYLADSGEAFGNRGNGYHYGWNVPTYETRERTFSDPRYNTFNQLQRPSNPSATWEIALENGTYHVFLVCGDPDTTSQINTVDVEGTVIPDPDGASNFDEYNLTVTVSDGRLTIRAAAGAINAKICFVDIVRDGYTNAPPWVQAGPDQTINWPGERTVQLAGVVVDDDPDELGLLTVRWSKASGPGNVTFIPADNLPETSARFDAPGLYELRLEAWDELMQSGTDTLKVHVKEAALLGDLDGNGIVDLADVAIFASRWLGGGENTADLDGSGQVDFVDYGLLLQNLGQRLSTVRINEFMAINSHTPIVSSWNIFTRFDGANPSNVETNPDWIELYNSDEKAIDLGGWSLTDSRNTPRKWTFPAGTVIPAGGYLMVFTSGKDQESYPDNYPFVDYYGALHTNFKLSSSGEYLALIEPDGRVAHAYDRYPRQYPLVSYGVSADGEEGYLHTPSPGTRLNNLWTGAANSERYAGAVSDVQFSVERGFYEQPFDVSLSCDTPGVIIRYTTDGSRPSVSHGTLYSKPVRISGTTMLRAAAFRTGWLSATVSTRTYIFLDQVVRQATDPDTGAIVPPEGCPEFWPSGGKYANDQLDFRGDYQMDPEVVGQNGTDLFGGLYANTIKDDLKSIPTLSIVMPRADWFGDEGIYVHRSLDGEVENWCSAELIDPAGGEEFQIDCAVRMQGGISTGGTSLHRWKSYKLSMRLVFRGGYGAGRLNFPLYGDKGADSFNTVVLESQLNNTWHHPAVDQQMRAQYTHDQYPSDLQNALGGYGTRGVPVHLYLSGLYWGLYWIHERPDEHFAESYLGGDAYDYDVLKHSTSDVVNGSNSNYIEMFNAGGSTVAQIQRYLDVPNFIDYILMNFYVGNTDWSHKNWYASRNRRDPAGRWRYHSWDAEHCLEGLNHDVTTRNQSYSPTGLHQKLTAGDPEYRRMFGDRVHQLFFNEGLLMPAGAAGMYQNLLDQIDRAVVGESARWGDNRRAWPYTRDVEWVAERDWLLNTYFPNRTQVVLNQLKARGLYPNTEAPVFNQHGGYVPNGFELTMSASPGTIYYTLDGSDPRITFSTAIAYTGPFVLQRSATVKARTLNAGQWSALNEATFAVGPVKESLRITELMYHPEHPAADSGYLEEDFEFIEMRNIGQESINLANVEFTNGVQFAFGPVDVQPGEFILVVKNEEAFRSRYTDFSGMIAGEYDARLSNSGERIRLVDALGAVIHNFTYSDNWYDMTDGDGFSLTIRDAYNPDLTLWDRKEGWRPSAFSGGSPGFDDAGPVPLLGSIVINELLAHSHDTLPDWVELHNTTGETINIGGWFLSDNDNDHTKYRIADNTFIGPYGYVVFYENLHFGNPLDPGCIRPFAFSQYGEACYVRSGLDENDQLTGYYEAVTFGASPTDLAFGRYQKSTGEHDFVAMSSNTPGGPNAYPKVGPIVISEIMHEPPHGTDIHGREFEYVELHNITDSAVVLQEYDPVLQTNVPWRFTDGIDYTFPPNTTIPARGYLIVAKNMAAFTSRYGSLTNVVGPYDGQLNNAGEKLELSMPYEFDANGKQHYLRVDLIHYKDSEHWPEGADGTGLSLTRINNTAYGNDAINWKAAAPTPGY